MIVPEHVKLPLLRTAAAQGADATVLPPMMRSGPTGAAVATAGAARTPVRAVAREATTMRMRKPGSFRGSSRWGESSNLISGTLGRAGAPGKTPIDTYHRGMVSTPYGDPPTSLSDHSVAEITVEIRCSAAIASACRHRPMGRSRAVQGRLWPLAP